MVRFAFRLLILALLAVIALSSIDVRDYVGVAVTRVVGFFQAHEPSDFAVERLARRVDRVSDELRNEQAQIAAARFDLSEAETKLRQDRDRLSEWLVQFKSRAPVSVVIEVHKPGCDGNGPANVRKDRDVGAFSEGAMEKLNKCRATVDALNKRQQALAEQRQALQHRESDVDVLKQEYGVLQQRLQALQGRQAAAELSAKLPRSGADSESLRKANELADQLDRRLSRDDAVRRAVNGQPPPAPAGGMNFELKELEKRIDELFRELGRTPR